MLKINKGIYKYKCVMFTYSLIKFTDAPLFILYMVCVENVVLKFLSQNDEILVPCADVSQIRECCVLCLNVFGNMHRNI